MKGRKTISMNYSISRFTGNGEGAGGKAPKDISIILEKDGWKTYEVYHKQNKFTMGIESLFLFKNLAHKVGINDVVLIQWPLYTSRWLNLNIEKSLKTNKKIVFIHDIESLRFYPTDIAKQNEEIKQLNTFDYIIAHNEKMKQWLVKMGITKPVFCLELFDYLMEPVTNENWKKDKFSVCFAGNLQKAQFLSELNMRTTLGLYGNEPETVVKKKFNYKGSFHPSELGKVMNENFGLIWDGDSCDTCSGLMGNYMQYNNPHKLSLYLACGKPVIVWKHAAISSFVKNNNAGIIINSLDEIDDVLNELSIDEYNKMLESAYNISLKVRDGFYTQSVIKDVFSEM